MPCGLADLVTTAREIVEALDHDCDLINRLIRNITDYSHDPRVFWVQGLKRRPRPGDRR
jgi:hypothetical protein